MTSKGNKVVEQKDVVVKFVGDSGDGMQLTGTLFSDAAAYAGNDLATFPDYPAEIRAPQNTVAGVSGFQVHFGDKKIHSSGDLCDVLVAMNPASLKANLKWAKKGATIIVDADNFDTKAFEKAGYETNPLEDGSLKGYNLIEAPITTLTKEAIKGMKVDMKTALKSKNMFALGIMFYIFDRKFDTAFHFIENKFRKKPLVVEVNKRVLQAGYNYADTMQESISVIQVPPAKIEKGRYRNLTGNVATAWGFLAAAERADRPLFLGSYPITPASEILQELAKYKSLGARVLQAEDEIAGITSTIGASYGGSLGITTTSGPGLSLKSEAIGLAVMTELPLVIVDVQRGGPSTGLPTKSEQSDLMQACYGRNGEAPVIVIAASSSANCFDYAFEASRLSLEHMTPVILLTDGYLANGSQLFKIPNMADMPKIKPPFAKPNDENYKPYQRDEETLVREWAIPGMEGLRHRLGGLEKWDITGNVSTDPENHQRMVELREEKVQKVAKDIPEQDIMGEKEGDLLVVSWGGSKGAVLNAVEELQNEGKSVSQAHFHYMHPLPENTEKVLSGFKRIIVPELNLGQFVQILRMKFPHFKYEQYNKVQGLPFTVSELKSKFNEILEEV
ncbi:MAG: 2-oxoacid:acceptor oxidoreductase subunit alpha [Bacteroidales bacterium]|nr:2-oxoacid:acceptor oxidoreductase subunit alpha [Bacteroidales bacterium]MCF8333526.1 2-oxoacid:acceptor oxidoreductase subunit alpha [Bacteroidales bacterium]